jgi:hypothetical protein
MKNLFFGIFIIVGLSLLFDAFNARAATPDLAITKGVAVTIDLEKLCNTKWGEDVRHVTPKMKQQVFNNYGLTGNGDAKCTPDKNGRRCEIDHLISRELGGADDVNNLWPQPYGGTCNASQKDQLENKLHQQVCDNYIDLEDAQQLLVHDWRDAYKTYIDKKGCGE